MHARRKIQTHVGFVLSMGLALALSWTTVHADDLNPPDYRGEPLSVHAHWLTDTTGALSLEEFEWFDDDDPATNLYPLEPTIEILPGANKIYQFLLPNIIDELPIKFMRVQLTWTGTTQPPISISSEAMDKGQVISGVQAFASTPLIFTQPDGGYQYFDFEFRPNPDYEWIQVQLLPCATLEQVVVDTISIPEPATLTLLLTSGLVVPRRRRC